MYLRVGMYMRVMYMLTETSGVEFSGTGVTEGCELPVKGIGNQQVLLTAKLSFQPQNFEQF